MNLHFKFHLRSCSKIIQVLYVIANFGSLYPSLMIIYILYLLSTIKDTGLQAWFHASISTRTVVGQQYVNIEHNSYQQGFPSTNTANSTVQFSVSSKLAAEKDNILRS